METGRSDDARPAAVEDRLLSTGLGFAVAAAAFQTVVHLVNAVLWDKRALNVNYENTPFAWASTVAAYSVAFVATVRAAGLGWLRWRYLALAAVAAFVSLDDMIAVHEDVGTNVTEALGLSESFDSIVWPVVYFPLLALGLALLVSFARRAPERPRRFIYAGLLLLGFALAAEVLSAPFTGGEEEPVHVLEGAFEEAAELAAWILIAVALTVLTLREFRSETR